MKETARIYLVFIVLICLAANLFAQPKTQPELKKEMVRVKYIKPSRVHILLRSYSSSKGRMMFDDSLGIITIKDTPEIVDKMLSVIREIDVKPVDLEFVADLFIASIGLGSEKKAGLKTVDDPVVRELKRLLNLGEFEPLDKSFARVQENRHLEMLMGGRGINLVLRLEPRYIREEKGGIIQMEMRLRQKKDEKVINLIETTLSIKSGERTIVGVSKLDGGEKALVLVISGKVI